MIHPFSLIERDSHPEPVYKLLQLKIDRALIATIVEETVEIVDYALGLPTTSRGRSSTRTKKDKEFIKFVGRVLKTTEVSTTDILVTLVYLRRARAHLSIDTQEWALHRVFLGALLLAHKYTNDSALRNISWSFATGAFGIRDIGRMEREFLDVLDFELSVSEADLLDLHETIFASGSPQSATQPHPFFHTSALERAPRPQGGVQMFRTRRVTDEDSDEEEDGSVSSGSFYEDEVSISPPFDEANSSDEETRVENRSSGSSSRETASSLESSSEPSTSTAATSAFSYNSHMVSNPVTDKDSTQKSVLSRALWLAGHQIISSLPTGLSQIAVSS